MPTLDATTGIYAGTRPATSGYVGAMMAWTPTPQSGTGLDAIAGAPLGSNTVPGTVGPSLGLTPFQARTLYVVHREIGGYQFRAIGSIGVAATNLSSAGSLNVNSEGTAGDGVPEYGSRVIPAGSSSANLFTSARTPGVHVIAAWSNTGLTTCGHQVDTVAAKTRAVTPGSGYDLAVGVNLAPADEAVGSVPLAAYAYGVEHDATTRAAIIAWLTQEYADTPGGLGTQTLGTSPLGGN